MYVFPNIEVGFESIGSVIEGFNWHEKGAMYNKRKIPEKSGSQKLGSF